MKLKNIFLSFAFAFCALAAVPAHATWSVAVDGGSGTAKITDGNWTLVLYYNNNNVTQARVKYSAHAGGTGVLDLTTVNADLEAAGSSFRITEVDYQGFNSKSVLTEVYLPDYITKLGERSFMYCSNLTKVCLSSAAVFVSSHTFSCCPNLETVYYNGVEPETGTVRIPASVTDIKNNVFEHGSGYNNGNTNRKIKRIYAPGITEIKGTAFQSCAALEYVYAPNATKIGANAFQHCVALDTVVISSNLNFVGAVAFDNTGLKTLYPEGTQNPEEGTVLMPTTLTTMDNYGHFMNGNYFARFTKFIARGMTDVPNRAFQNCSQLVSVEFSPSLTALRTNGTSSDNSVFYNCTSLKSITPSTWGANFVIGPGTFRSCSSLTNYLDLSRTGIDTIPSMWAAYTALEGVTFPASLTTFSGDQHFREMQKGAKFRFLGDRPTSTATADKSSFYTKNKNNTSQRHVFIVDAATYPAWTNGTDFVAMADINSNSDTSGAFSTSSADFPTPDYPAETLGATIWGSGNGRYNWVVQYVDHTKADVTWMNGEASFATTQVELGHTPTAPAGTPAKASTDEFEYTFIGWNTNPSATTAIDLSTVIVTGETTLYAIYSSSTRTYTITWQMDDLTAIDTTSVAYGIVPTHADPSKPSDASYSYTFSGWSTNGTDVIVSLPAVTGAATYIAVFAQHDLSSTVTVSWFNEDGTTPLDPAETTVKKGDRPTHAEPTKTPTIDTAYTFAGWVELGSDGSVTNATADLPTASADVAYKATYSSAVRQYTVVFADWDGSVISSAAYDYNTPAASVVVPSETPTRPATAEYSYAFAGWDAVIADVTADATYTATYDATPVAYTATFVNGQTGETISTADFAYGTAVTAPEPPEVEGYTFDSWSPAISVMPAANTTYTAAYTLNNYTIKWMNANGVQINTTKVDHGTTPTHAAAEMSATSKESYTFAGWDPAIEPAVSNTTYTAVYTRTILSPMVLALRASTYDHETGAITVAATVLNPGVGGEITGTITTVPATAGDTVEVEGGTNVTATITQPSFGKGYEWVLSVTQSASGVDETVTLKGRTWARRHRDWFAEGDVMWTDGGYAPGSASAASQQVRVNGTLTFSGNRLPNSLPEASGARLGIAAYQKNAGTPAAWYAWNGAEWVALSGASPSRGATVELLGVVDFARKVNHQQSPAVAWYADGVQLFASDGEWEVGLSGGTRLSSFAYTGDDNDVVGFSADYDMPAFASTVFFVQ